MRNDFVAEAQIQPDRAVHSLNTPTNTNSKSNAGPLDWPNDDSYLLTNAPRELFSYTIPDHRANTSPMPIDHRANTSPMPIDRSPLRRAPLRRAPCLIGQVSFHSYHHTQMHDECVGELSIVGQTTAELAVSAHVPYDDKITTLRKYGEAVTERAR
jgi:hypothetical protein